MLRQRRLQPVAVLVGERRFAQIAQRRRRKRRTGPVDDGHQHVEMTHAALVRVAVALDQTLALRHLDGELGMRAAASTMQASQATMPAFSTA